MRMPYRIPGATHRQEAPPQTRRHAGIAHRQEAPAGLQRRVGGKALGDVARSAADSAHAINYSSARQCYRHYGDITYRRSTEHRSTEITIISSQMSVTDSHAASLLDDDDVVLSMQSDVDECTASMWSSSTDDGSCIFGLHIMSRDQRRPT